MDFIDPEKAAGIQKGHLGKKPLSEISEEEDEESSVWQEHDSSVDLSKSSEIEQHDSEKLRGDSKPPNT